MVVNIIALESAPTSILALSEPSSADSPPALTATAITKAASGIAYEVIERPKPLMQAPARCCEPWLHSRTDRSKHSPVHAVFCVTNPSSSTIASRIKNFCGLPVTVIGNSVRKRMWRGIL